MVYSCGRRSVSPLGFVPHNSVIIGTQRNCVCLCACKNKYDTKGNQYIQGRKLGVMSVLCYYN